MKLGKSLIARIAAVSMALTLAQTATVALAQDDAPRFDPPSAAAATVPAPVTDYSVSFTPRVPESLPLLAVGGVGGAAALLCAYYMLRRRPGAMMLTMAGVAMAVTIADPHVGRDQWQPFETIVPVITDGSFSQQLGDRPAMTAAARQDVIDALSAIPGVRALPVDAAEQGVTQEDGTRVFTALPEHVGDIPADRLGGVIVVTDGQVHDILEKTRTVPKDVPVYVVVTGHEGETDRRMVLEEAPAYGVVDKDQTLRFRVVDDGVAQQGKAVRVTITADGQTVANPVVATGQLTEVTVKIPHAGANVIALEVEGLDGELTPVNNRVVTSINGTQDRMRVLLVSGAPNNSVRSWRTLLKSDDNVDLAHFTILSDPARQALMPVYELSLIAFPAEELFVDKIDSFDLVIMDHFDNFGIRKEGLLKSYYFDSFARYVENGGALLVAAGDEFANSRSLYDTALKDVLPVRPAGDVTTAPYKPEISPEGLRHPVTRGLGDSKNWAPWQRVINTEVTGDAHVVMTGPDDQPLVVLDRVGEGRVGVIASDSAWLWARGIDGGGPYNDMMRRVSQWLMQEPALEEESLRMAWNAQKGSLQITRQTLAPDTAPPVVALQQPDGSVRQVTLSAAGPGLWRADVDKPDYGVYRAQQGDQTVMTSVGHAYTRELAAMLSTTEIMRQVAEESRGQVVRFAQANGQTGLPVIAPVYNVAADGKLSDDRNWGIRMTGASELKSNDRYSIPAWLSLGMFALFLGLGLAREKYPNVNPFRAKPPSGPSPQ